MSNCRRTVREADQGLGLLEFLLVLSLCALLIGAVYEAVLIGLRVVNAADDREHIRQQIASVLDRFTREAILSGDVDRAESGRFQFDTPDVNNVDYEYDSSASTLSRDDASNPQVIILRNVTVFDFDYFDGSGTQFSEPVPGSSEDDVRLVRVTATVTKDNETLTLTGAAFLRNMS